MQLEMVSGARFLGVARAAEELGMNRTMLSRLLHGHVRTTAARADAIRRATGVRVKVAARRRTAAKAKKEGGAR